MQLLCEYDPVWPHWFKLIEQYLHPRARGVLRLEHVGSTSIAGIAAKPIIDLDAVVEDGTMADAIASIEGAGYRHQGDLGILGREAFEPVTEGTRALPPHHLYACEASSLELRKHVSFREYLRAHPAEARRLADYKRRLVFEQHLSRPEYVQAKAAFVSELAEVALAWHIASHDA